jgi:cytochrome P450
MSDPCPYIDFTSDYMRDHLYGEVARLRSECPVVHTEAHGGYWVVTRYEDVLRVLQDPGSFTATEGVVVPRPDVPLRALPLESDPPQHRDYRRVLNPFLTPEASARLEPDIRQIADRYIDGFIERGSCDLATDFAQHISTTVLFGHLLGASEDEMAGCHDAVLKFAYEPTSDTALEGALHLMQFCYSLLEARRTEPGDGIVDAIVGCRVDDRPIDDLEAIGMVSLLIFGGVETTANATCSAIIRLSDDPELQASMRAEPERIGGAIDEFLRLDPPLIGLARRATHDVELGGQLIRKGDAVYYSLAAANRDPEEFQSPDDFDPTRVRNRHLAFSGGVHRCAGSNLARAMLRVSLEQLLDRLEDIEVAGPVEYIQAAARGIKTLPIRFRQRQVASLQPAST